MNCKKSFGIFSTHFLYKSTGEIGISAFRIKGKLTFGIEISFC